MCVCVIFCISIYVYTSRTAWVFKIWFVMEYGGITEDSKLSEVLDIDGKVFEPRTKENVVLNLDGSNKSNEDEAFEKAVEAETMTVNSDNSVITEDGNIELVGTDNINLEVQKFEEVIVTPSAIQNLAESGAKAVLLMREEHLDEKRLDMKKVARDGRNGLVDDVTVEYGMVDSFEIDDSIAAAAETEKLNGRVEVKENLLKSPQKSEKVVSDNSIIVETSTSGDAKTADVGGRDVQILQMSETPESHELRGAETDPEKLDMKGCTCEISEIRDSNEVKGGDIGFERPESGVSDHVHSIGTLNHEGTRIPGADRVKEQTHETSSETGDAKGTKRSEDCPVPESKSNGDILCKNKLDVIVNKPVAILGSDYQHEEIENPSTNLPNVVKEDCVGEDSFISNANPKNYDYTEYKELGSENVKAEKGVIQDVDWEESKGISVADPYATDYVKESSGFDSNFLQVVEGSTANLEIGKVEKPSFSSSELLAKISGCSQSQLVDASSEVSSAVIDGQENEEVKDENKELYFSGDITQEIRPGTGTSTHSSNSPTSGLIPAHIAIFESAAPVHEPVSHDNPINIDHEIKPVAAILSSNYANPHPAGLGHAVPLGESASCISRNKERGSRSAADIPSTNSNFASARPAGLGRVAPLLDPTSRTVQQPRMNGAVSAMPNQLLVDSTNGVAEEYDETREKLQMIRVKFLRLARRLGQTPHNVVVAEVLYRLGLAEQLQGRSGSRVAAFSYDRASAMAEQLEAAGQEPLDFTCTIMVLGKTGVGKSATINSIFDEVMFGTDAFQLGTKKVQDIVGTVQGIRVRVIDTPGLLPSWSDQCQNEKILRSVKRFIKKTPPDIVLYLDRLDMQSRDFGDMPLLRTITEIFGPSVWVNAIVILTHAASAPPEGPNGTATSYDMFVTQRSHVVQQAICQAAGDMRLMNPVSLVENHSACRTNRAGQRVLPNGQVWKPHLLLLSFASKILAEANTLLKLQDGPPGMPFAPRTRSPPLHFLLSSLLQSRPEVRLPSEQFGDDDDAIDDDLDESLDSDDESEYDKLPPFKSLTKAELEKLSKMQRDAYYDELEYRENLYMKKQLKEEKRQRKIMRQIREAAKNFPAEYGDNGEEEARSAASVQVPMPDLTLPTSFDSDNPTYRYRPFDSSNPWLVRPDMEPNGWDHDIGYDGINVERLFVVKDKVPVSFSSHLSKDKKDANLQMEITSSIKHGKGKATSVSFDLQSVGKDIAYTLRTETIFSNHRINKAAAGLSATLLGDVLTGGLKVEDKLLIGKRGQLVVSGGAMYGRGDVAYGGILEATLKDKDHPLGRFLSTLLISFMDSHGDLAIGCNSQTQIPIGRHTNLIGRVNINNKGSGQLSVRINSSEHLQIVFIGLIPLAKKLLGYSQPVQYG